ncbi:MAG: protein kinase domain-containing protein [Solirubrobacteraceae bacterium]
MRARNPSRSQAPTRVVRGAAPTEPTRVAGAAADDDAARRDPARNERAGADGERTRSDGPIVLRRYRLRRRLGTGGFATVWLARDERLDREVAVKILSRERVIGGRFEREARAAARLAHPGIVTLYEAAVDDEGAYLVSEFVQGTTLDRLLADGRLSDRDVVQIGIAVCEALAHAHANGVIHRDVKPSNVLIPERPTSPAGLARLTDFGVARVLGGDSLTVTGDVIGTVAYMAPEQAQGLPAGASADLFSLALVLYEALTGVNPIRTGAATRPHGRRLGMHLAPLRRQRRDLPRELGQAIDLALRPRPGERGRLDELRDALVTVAARMQDEPGVIGEPWRPRTKVRRRPDTDELHLRIEDHRRRAESEVGDDADAASEGRRAPTPEDRRVRTPKNGRRGRVRSDEGEADEPVGARFRREKFHIPWPRRALAGTAAAATVAWLAHHAPGSSPVPAAATACVAGVLVAALPRAGWFALTAFMATCLVTHSHAAAALLLVAGALVPVVMSPRDGPAWPLAAGAPALGAIGLAGAWPAVAGFAGPAWRRAMLAATGLVWLALAHATYTASTDASVHHVLAPVLTVGTPVGAGVWAAAAIVLPWAGIRRSPVLEAALLAGWAGALALGTVAATNLGASGPHLTAGAAIVGAIAGAFVALVTRRAGHRLGSARWAKDCAPTA